MPSVTLPWLCSSPWDKQFQSHTCAPLQTTLCILRIPWPSVASSIYLYRLPSWVHLWEVGQAINMFTPQPDGWARGSQLSGTEGQSMGCRLVCPVGREVRETPVGGPLGPLAPAHTGEGWAWSQASPSSSVLQIRPVSTLGSEVPG